jgi:hypothetical protein
MIWQTAKRIKSVLSLARRAQLLVCMKRVCDAAGPVFVVVACLLVRLSSSVCSAQRPLGARCLWRALAAAKRSWSSSLACHGVSGRRPGRRPSADVVVRRIMLDGGDVPCAVSAQSSSAKRACTALQCARGEHRGHRDGVQCEQRRNRNGNASPPADRGRRSVNRASC